MKDKINKSHAINQALILNHKRKSTSPLTKNSNNLVEVDKNNQLANLSNHLNNLTSIFNNNMTSLSNEIFNHNKINLTKLIALSLTSMAFTDAYLYSRSQDENSSFKGRNEFSMPTIKSNCSSESNAFDSISKLNLNLQENNYSDEETKNTLNTPLKTPLKDNLFSNINNQIANYSIPQQEFNKDVKTTKENNKKIYFNIIRSKVVEPQILSPKQILKTEAQMKINQNVAALVCNYANNRIKSLTKIDNDYISNSIIEKLKASINETFYYRTVKDVSSTEDNPSKKVFEQFGSNSILINFVNKPLYEVLKEYFYSKAFNKELYELSKLETQDYMRSLVKAFESLLIMKA